MRVEIWADLVCPWCLIGKRRFEQALAVHEDDHGSHGEVEVVYRSFQLDPHMPKDRTEKQAELLAAKYGWNLHEVHARQSEIERMAAAEGLDLHLIGGETGNTFDAHRLCHLGRELGRGEAIVERFFSAHFTEQRSLFEPGSLTELAIDAGLDPARVREVLASDAYSDAVIGDGRRARQLGATGVPFFVIDDRVVISGAQRPELFVRGLEQASRADEELHADPAAIR